jgi:hypothetical protein
MSMQANFVRRSVEAVRLGEASVANEAIDMLTDQVTSASSLTHLHDVWTALRPYRHLPAVGELTNAPNGWPSHRSAERAPRPG